MKGILSPNGSSDLISYSSSTIDCLERSDVAEDTSSLISGSTFNNGKLAWLARGSSLEIVNTKTGLREAAWRFGWSSKQKRAVIISAVVAFPMADHDRLVVGLKDISGGLPGMVCLFDPYVSRVIKAVVVPYPVTALDSVIAAGGAGAPPSLLSFNFKLFFGMVAVGTEQGHSYLLDMRLDDELEEFDEWNPSLIELVDCKEKNIAAFREQARENGTHLAVEIGGHYHKSGKFHYSKPESKEKKSFPSGDIFVTAIKYIQQAGCLVIGYNFGCFQIWDLNTVMLVYSSQVDQYEMSAITHLAYQEPENDPRSCSYLWVSRGPLVIEDELQLEVPTTLTLYQLIFGSREILPGYGIVYKDLGGCGRRFEHQLTADAHHLADATSVGSKVICCFTLEKESLSHDVSKPDEGLSRDLTLMVCVWEAPSHDPMSSPLCHLGIFDVNRWYHSQMQPSIRDAMFGSKDSTCPFFAFFSLAEILDIANPDGIVDVYINSHTVSRFKSNTEPALEQHYWPASLKFDTCCLMETSLVHSKFFGMQRQILSSLRGGGLSSLSEAHEYFNMCWAAGLLPRNFDISKSQEKNFHLEAILSVSLEHGLITFITTCIHRLGAGNVTHAGCSLRLILDWSWSKVVQMKEQLDQLSVPLFDGGGGTPDDQMLLMLDDMSVQLGHLKSIFQSLLSQSAPSSQQGLRDIEAKFQVVNILSMYLNLLLWLIGHGLLPEYAEDVDSSFHQRDIYYSSAAFNKFYDARRAELHQCGSELTSGGLMIDKIISQFDGLWVTSSGKEHYPPTSLHSLSSLYLLDKVSPETKHSIVFYLLLDICGANAELNSLQISDRFAKAFDLSYNMTKMIRAFWFLDHKEFQNAVNLLVDPSLATVEIGPWQNSYIIKTLLFQGQFQKVLYFINTVHPTMLSPEDVHLYLTVLVANGLVTEAFNFQRNHRDPSINTDLLFHFFTGCQQSGNISKVMQLPFNDVEEECFVQFLQRESFEAAKELLVMYYLQRGRYVEGVRLNEQLKQDTVNEQNPIILERTKVRNAIVDGYIQCLPNMQRKLIFTQDKMTSYLPSTLKEVPRPKPLSTVIHRVKQGRPVSHATILNSVMEKVAEARPPNTPQRRRSGAFVGTPLTPRTKGASSDSHRMVFASLKKPEVVTEEPPKSSQPLLTTPSFVDKKRRKQLYSGADALTLLTTPLIAKHSSKQGSVPHVESISVSSTPQSILKVKRIVRRATPLASPMSSPPMTRRGSIEQPQSKQGSRIDFESQSKDSVDFHLETPSRRIRFATEDSLPSPTGSQATEVTVKEVFEEPQSVAVEASKDTSTVFVKSVGFKEATESSSEQDSRGESSLRLELSRSTEEEEEDEKEKEKEEEGEGEGEPEVQITAAVVDLRGNSDIEEDVIVHEEEDYSSYELDESDNVIAGDSEEEIIMRKEGGNMNYPYTRDQHHVSKTNKLVLVQEKEILQVAGSSETDSEGPLMRSEPKAKAQICKLETKCPLILSSPRTSTGTASTEVKSVERILLERATHLGKTGIAAEDPLQPPISPPKQTHSPKETTSERSPRFSPQPTPETTKLQSRTDPNLTMTPPKSPHTSPLILPSHSNISQVIEELSVTEKTDSNVSSPPDIVRTPKIADDVGTKSGEKPSGHVSTPSTNFLFSPPLTRSMIKRRSLDVSALGKSSTNRNTPSRSVTRRSLRPRSQTGKYTPHQSPSDSPISFLSPVSTQPTSPKGRRKTKKLVPKPLHSMTLRTRQCPIRGTRSAKLPHSEL